MLWYDFRAYKFLFLIFCSVLSGRGSNYSKKPRTISPTMNLAQNTPISFFLKPIRFLRGVIMNTFMVQNTTLGRNMRECFRRGSISPRVLLLRNNIGGILYLKTINPVYTEWFICSNLQISVLSMHRKFDMFHWINQCRAI